MKEYFKIGDLVYLVVKGVLYTNTLYRVIAKQGSITIVPENILRKCEYLGKSKGFETLFEVK